MLYYHLLVQSFHKVGVGHTVSSYRFILMSLFHTLYHQFPLLYFFFGVEIVATKSLCSCGVDNSFLSLWFSFSLHLMYSSFPTLLLFSVILTLEGSAMYSSVNVSDLKLTLEHFFHLCQLINVLVSCGQLGWYLQSIKKILDTCIHGSCCVCFHSSFMLFNTFTNCATITNLPVAAQYWEHKSSKVSSLALFITWVLNSFRITA